MTMDIGYKWIYLRKSSDMDIIYWSVRVSSRRGGDGVHGLYWPAATINLSDT